MQAIENASIQIDTIKKSDITYFSYSDFKIPNPDGVIYTSSSLRFLIDRETSSIFLNFKNTSKQQPIGVQSKLKNIYELNIFGETETILKDMIPQVQKPIFKINQNDIDKYLEKSKATEVYNKLDYYCKRVTKLFESNSQIYKTIQKTKKFAHNTNENDVFTLAIDTSILAKHIFPIFANAQSEYNKIVLVNHHKKLKNPQCQSLPLPQNPWDSINEMLSSFPIFKYKIDSPPLEETQHYPKAYM